MTSFAHHIGTWLLVAGCCSTSLAADNRVERYEGVARDAEGRVLYREIHWLSGTSPQRDLLVLFSCPDGAPFARKYVHEEGRPLAPSFMLEDARFGYREGVRAGPGKAREIYVRRRAEDLEKKAPLEDSPDLVIDAGIDAYIKANWDALIAGNARAMPFVVPSRLRTYRFRIKRVGGAARVADTSHRFRLELNAWYAFAIPSIDMIYDAQNRVVREYVGIANVRNATGASLTARIDFPAARRFAVDAGERDAALETPLDGRCVL